MHKRNAFSLSLALCAAALFMAITATAQDKTAYVNMEKIFEEYYKTVNANIAFEQQKQDFEERVTMLRGELEALAKETQKFEEDSQNELLSMAVREDSRRKFQLRLERFRGKNEEFERFRQENMQKLQRIRGTKEEELVEELLTMVRKFAEVRGYSHVYEVSGRTLNRVPVLLVYPKDQDVTDVVVNIANAGHEEELADAKARYEALRNRNKPAESAGDPAPPAADAAPKAE
ncbi:MAG TPA: OmpH family outer membrane protein [Lentisphaeria bacterium]|nr:OmpH family outer membrane protein [Lentisphaeria bacterium]